MTTADDFKKAIDLINKSTSWIVTSHTRPDGDAVGCMKSMCQIASQLGKSAKPILLSPPAQWYEFIFDEPVPVLGNEVKLEELKNGSFGSFDLVVIVDTNSYVQLTEFDKWLKDSNIPVLVIDHHISGDGLGTVELVDSTAAATGEIVFDLLKAADWEITPQIAEALYIAISTDTGWFRFDNTDARVMRNASSLIELGAKPSRIYHKMYQNYSPARLKLLARMLDNLELHSDGRIALQIIMRSDFDATGATGTDTEEFVNECQRVASVEAAALFVELSDGGFRCSLRSNGSVDVRQIAQKFGGGGHKVAAGVNLKGPLENAKNNILTEFKKALSNK
ncbi:MAG: bifunctional oligoribonuclease/PAP phosphatase NrnA [Sedimentisphaerales bacterium]|nr:bifunctional oligoribonuclease/PAP phosphatase NrnA [Sedimentisphaerales bacterium]